METCSRKTFTFWKTEGEKIMIYFVYLFILYNPPLLRIYIVLSDCLVWCGILLRWQSAVDVWNYPSAFRVYYNNAPVTLDDSCFCETFTYSLNYYSYLSCLYMTTERKSIRVANWNKFGAGSDVSPHSLTYVRMYIFIFQWSLHIFDKTCLNFFLCHQTESCHDVASRIDNEISNSSWNS